jgi:hypothetical protein
MIFQRAFGIGLGFGLGLGAVLLVGFIGYQLYGPTQRRIVEHLDWLEWQAAEPTRVSAAATRAVAAEIDRAQRAAASATALAARRCDSPEKLLITTSLRQSKGPYGDVNHFVDGTVRNTCTYEIEFKMEFSAVAPNNTTVLVNQTMGIEDGGRASPYARATLLRPGTERAFRTESLMKTGSNPAEMPASIRATPIIVREGAVSF